MSNPNERFSTRIKQRDTGAWAAVWYHASKREALEYATRKAAGYVWAVFDGRKKVVDSRGWSGDIDFECGEQPPEMCPECARQQLTSALAVVVLDPKIRAFLEANDPKALEQAEAALKEAGGLKDVRFPTPAEGSELN
jgi:hypothetical protein